MKKLKESKLTQKIGRPKILEPTIPKEIWKKLRDIADLARLPMQVVYEDSLLNGISTLLGEDGMYTASINFRKNRDALIAANELDGPVVQKPEAIRETQQVLGASNGEFDTGFDDVSGPEEGTVESSGDDLKRRGLFEEGLADTELRTEYSGEPGE